MIRTVILRLRPDKLQRNKMMRIAGCARFCYNELLKYWDSYYTETDCSPSVYELRDYVSMLKQQYEWLDELPYHTMNGVIKNLQAAFGKFFKKKAGYPSIHKKNSNHISFPTRTDRIKFDGVIVTVPSVGKMRFKNISKYELNGIKTASLVYDGLCWYLKIATSVCTNTSCQKQGKLGIDLGYRTLASVYDGTDTYTYENIMNENETEGSDHIQKLEKRLQVIDKIISDKKKLNKISNNINKLYYKRAKLKRRMANIQRTYQHIISKYIISRRPIKIIFETLDISEQKAKDNILPNRYKLTALYQFYIFIIYKAEELGIQIIRADKYYPSTKRCCKCGAINEVGVSKVYTCKNCNLKIDRDINASINLYNYV